VGWNRTQHLVKRQAEEEADMAPGLLVSYVVPFTEVKAREQPLLGSCDQCCGLSLPHLVLKFSYQCNVLQDGEA
jgi:hypothetical protein